MERTNHRLILLMEVVSWKTFQLVFLEQVAMCPKMF